MGTRKANNHFRFVPYAVVSLRVIGAFASSTLVGEMRARVLRQGEAIMAKGADKGKKGKSNKQKLTIKEKKEREKRKKEEKKNR